MPQEIVEVILFAWERTPFSAFLTRMVMLYIHPELKLENCTTNYGKFAIWEIFEALTLSGIIFFIGQYGFEKLAKIKFAEYINPFIISLEFIINIIVISLLFSIITSLFLTAISFIRIQFRAIRTRIFIPLFLQSVRAGAFEILLLAMLGVFLFYRLYINCSFAKGINWVEIVFVFILALYIFIVPLRIMIRPVYLVFKNHLHPAISVLICFAIASTTLIVHSKLRLSTNKEAIYFKKITQDFQESPCFKRQLKK